MTIVEASKYLLDNSIKFDLDNEQVGNLFLSLSQCSLLRTYCLLLEEDDVFPQVRSADDLQEILTKLYNGSGVSFTMSEDTEINKEDANVFQFGINVWVRVKTDKGDVIEYSIDTNS